MGELDLFSLEKSERGSYQCIEVSEGGSQPLLGGAKQQNKRQWAKTDAKQDPPEYKKELLYSESDASTGTGHPERLWRYSKLSGHNPVQCALG